MRDAMIVAGGRGTRLRPLTWTTPKPLLPFCGAPFLEGVVRRLADVGVERVLLVVGADTAAFDAFGAEVGPRTGVTVETVPEPEPLDTAGGVRAALDRVDGTFLVLNGDILTDVDLAAAHARHREVGAGATLVLVRVEDTSSYGVCVRDGTRIVSFVEKPEPGTLPGQDTVNAGTYVLEPHVLERFAPGSLSFERDVFPTLVADGVHVEGFVGDAVWADLGTPDRFLAGHRAALDGELVWPSLADLPADAQGRRIAADAEVADDVQVVGPALLLPGARVASGATVGPHAVVGAGTHVGAGAVVVDSVLGADGRIGAGVTAHGLLTGTGVVVGDAAAVPAGAVLGDGVVVGAGERLAADERRPAEDPGVVAPRR